MNSKINKKTNNFSIVLKIILFLMFIFLLYIIISKCNMSTIKMNSKERYINSETPLPQDSGTCNTPADIVDFCINYNSCCASNPPTKECLCNHPFVKNCRTNFTNCLNNNPKQLSQNDLMTNCINENKTCCIAYNNNLSISSTAFNSPIKNDPVIKPLCSFTSVPNIDQKCLEICSTTPKCAAYSLSTGSLVKEYGTCTLYDNVSIATPSIDKSTGMPIPFISDYYIKK